MEKVMDLLKGTFWKIDLDKFCLSSVEVDFLNYFFDVSVEQFIDDLTGQERVFLVLTKKPKFVSNPYLTF